MNYKIEGAFKKGRVTIIIAIILWLLLAIVFVMPWTLRKSSNRDFRKV